MFDIFVLGSAVSVPAVARTVTDLSEASQSSRTRFFWLVTARLDLKAWDWTWEPPPWQSSQRHAWRDQFGNDAGIYLMSGPDYQHTNWHHDLQVVRITDPQWWHIPPWIDPDSLDPHWAPNSADEPFIYEFPVEWGWDHVGGPEYRVPGAVARKYVTDFVAHTLSDPANFEIRDRLDPREDLFRWRPNPKDPPYVYVFGNQWWPAEKKISAVYITPGATQIKYMSEPRANRLSDQTNYQVLIAGAEFDFSWEPDPGDPPYVYVFGNQWHPAEVMPTVEYHAPGASERKYMDIAARLPQRHCNRWHTLIDCEWDYSWVPDPGDPPYIYVFGNQWHPAEIMPTVEYHVPGASERKYMEWPRAALLPDRTGWCVTEDVDHEIIDYSWKPDPGSPPYVYHFGTQHQASVGVTYTVPGAMEIKFAGDIPTIDHDHAVMLELDCFYIDFSNALSAQRFQALQARVPNLQQIRYVNNLLDTLRRCSRKSHTARFWAVSSHNDYSDFDFSWHPETWQRGMIHVFGTQWSKWSDTFLINRWEFDRQAAWQTRMEDFYNLNFVTDHKVTAATDAADIIVIDHGNRHRDLVLQQLAAKTSRIVRTGRYFDNYLDTLRRLLDDVQAQHVWVVSSLCDYSDFDFSWQPEAWQRDMLHVFPTGDQKFGDTFYVPTQALRSAMPDIQLLDWFETVNYCSDQRTKRWPMPVIVHDHDSHVQAIPQIDCSDPLMLLATHEVSVRDLPTVSLWRDATKTVIPLDAAASVCVVPREALAKIDTQFYDWPYIDQQHRNMFPARLQDVVFISYDEPEADHNWEILSGLCPRAQRLHGVSGIENALEAAADLSSTPWFFAVFAKTRLEPSFDFQFVPDYLQQPKHYIFNCRNSVNGLEYGHMGVILHNCAAIREVNRRGEWGLDYTLSWPSESIPILSCHGDFNTTPYHTWRTAFRETAKLAWFEQQHSTVEGAYRLRIWLSRAQGAHSEWCLRGAQDGERFFRECGGELDQLRQSFRWQWLRSRFQSQYGDVD